MLNQKELENQIKITQKAIASFQNAISEYSGKTTERDWTIQRFEYTIELIHKTIRKFFLYKWIEIDIYPKDIFRLATKQWIIKNINI